MEALDVSYPIVKGTDNDHYLHYTFEGQQNAAGAIFMEHTNNSNFEDCNTIIYGHNMKKRFHVRHLQDTSRAGKPDQSVSVDLSAG